MKANKRVRDLRRIARLRRVKRIDYPFSYVTCNRFTKDKNGKRVKIEGLSVEKL